MSRGTEVFIPPPHGPSQPRRTGKEEHPTPGGKGKDEGNERRRSHGTYGGPGVHDPHCQRTLANGEPFVNRFGSGRKSAPFTHAEKKPADGKHPEAGRKSVTGASQRPPEHDHEKPCSRPKRIQQLAPHGIHDRVRYEECGL